MTQGCKHGLGVHDVKTDEISCTMEKRHKSTVTDYFSDTTLYWENLYEKINGKFPSYDSYMMTKRMETVLQLLDGYAMNRSLQVLDVGCGPGVVLEEVFRRGHKGTGLDVSTSMVDEANRRLGKFIDTTHPCRSGDIEDLPYPDNTFDVVLCLGVLMYLLSDHKALSEINRVVKPGGLVLLVLPNLVRVNMLFDPYYFYRAAKHAMGSLPRKRMSHFTSLVPKNVKSREKFTIRRYVFTGLPRLLKQHDFTNIRLSGVDYSPLTLWGKHVFPTGLNIALSERLAGISGTKGFGWLHALANQWVICMTRR